MISLPNREAITAALNTPLSTGARSILERLIENAELLEMTHVVILEAGDGEQVLQQEIGFDPTANPVDGVRFDEAGFEPYWAHLTRHAGIFELCHCIGNDGFAFAILIPEDSISDLVRMCRRYA